MTCGECGAELKETAKFCSKCGNAIEIQKEDSKDVKKEGNRHRKGRKFLIFVLVVVGLAWILFGGRGYKATINKYIDAVLTADAKTMISLAPEEYVKYAVEFEVFESKKAWINETQLAADTAKLSRDKEYGKGWTYKVEILGFNKYDKDECEWYLEINDLDTILKGVKSIADAEIVVRIYDSDDNEVETMYQTITLLKMGRKWYIGDIT